MKGAPLRAEFSIAVVGDTIPETLLQNLTPSLEAPLEHGPLVCGQGQYRQLFKNRIPLRHGLLVGERSATLDEAG